MEMERKIGGRHGHRHYTAYILTVNASLQPGIPVTTRPCCHFSLSLTTMTGHQSSFDSGVVRVLVS